MRELYLCSFQVATMASVLRKQTKIGWYVYHYVILECAKYFRSEN